MKPEDVMKALECCDGSLGGCEKCPNYKNRFRCMIKKDALALLREKDEEIERLREEKVVALRSTIENAKANARADTVRKMKDRLINYESYDNGGGNYVVSVCDIRTVAKDMLEDVK